MNGARSLCFMWWCILWGPILWWAISKPGLIPRDIYILRCHIPGILSRLISRWPNICFIIRWWVLWYRILSIIKGSILCSMRIMWCFLPYGPCISRCFIPCILLNIISWGIMQGLIICLNILCMRMVLYWNFFRRVCPFSDITAARTANRRGWWARSSHTAPAPWSVANRAVGHNAMCWPWSYVRDFRH